jgi:putative membrane protein
MPVKALFAAYIILWLYLAFEPLDRFDWVLDNLLVFLLGPPFLYYMRRFRFSQASCVLIILYLALCAVGAHWSYSFVPAGDWFRDAFGLERNHYDRFVHFSFGLLLAYPLKEWLERAVKVPPPWPYSFAPLLLVAFSAIFECIEAIVVEAVNPELGMIFLGAQGDPWDAQKDMLVALLGGALAMGLARLSAGKAPPANNDL